MRKLLVSVVTLLSALAATALSPTGASGMGAELPFLALGDSVASGAELGEVASYPRHLGSLIANETGRPVRYWNRARPGEQSAGVVATQLNGLGEFSPEVVTLTVGANDFLIPTFECIASKLDDQPGDRCSLPDPRVTIPSLESNVRQILYRVTGETQATVFVTTYFNPFPRGSRCAAGLVDLSIGLLNASIGRVVGEFGERATLVDISSVFRGHEGREPDGWFMPSPFRFSCGDIHPSAEGHRQIAAAIWNVVGPRVRV